jgi:hypothetical protein
VTARGDQLAMPVSERAQTGSVGGGSSGHPCGVRHPEFQELHRRDLGASFAGTARS